MYYPSGYYRAKAREALKGHWQTALLIALIVNLPTLLAQGVATFTGNDPIDRLQAIIIAANRDGVMSRQLMVNEIRAFLTSSGFLSTQGINLVAWLITPCLSLGMYKWLINRLQKQEDPVNTVFCRARLFFKAIGLQLMIILKILLWMLPGIGLMLAGLIPLLQGKDAATANAAMQLTDTLTLPAVLLMGIPGILAALRYAMSEFILADSPETRITECIRQSKKIMRDQKKTLALLVLSFLLWYLLELLVASFLAGMGASLPSLVVQMFAGLALHTYVSASIAAFYLQNNPKYAPRATQEAEPEAAPSPEAE